MKPLLEGNMAFSLFMLPKPYTHSLPFVFLVMLTMTLLSMFQYQEQYHLLPLSGDEPPSVIAEFGEVNCFHGNAQNKAEIEHTTADTFCKSPLPKQANITAPFNLTKISTDRSRLTRTEYVQRPFSSSRMSVDTYAKTEELWGCYDYLQNRLGASRTPASDIVQRNLGCKKRAPDAILLGVKKCGSQTLTGFLDLHPDVVSAVYPFSESAVRVFGDNNTNEIIRNMPLSTRSELTFIDLIEIQDHPETLRNLLRISTRFLLILVNPVLRAQSDYAHVLTKMKLPENANNVKNKKMPVWDVKLRGRVERNVLYKGYRIADSFEKSVLNASGDIDETNQLIRKGLYLDYVKEILKHIARKNLLVIDGEMFVEEPWTILRKVERFLGIREFFTRGLFQKKGNFFCPVLEERPDAGCLKGKGRKKRKVYRTVKLKLQYYYQPKNRQLKEILHQNFSWK